MTCLGRVSWFLPVSLASMGKDVRNSSCRTRRRPIVHFRKLPANGRLQTCPEPAETSDMHGNPEDEAQGRRRGLVPESFSSDARTPKWAIHRNRRSHEPDLPKSARIKEFRCFAEQAVGRTPMGRDDDPDEDCWFRPVWEHEPDETRWMTGPRCPAFCLLPFRNPIPAPAGCGQRTSPACSVRSARPRTRWRGWMREPAQPPRRCAKGFAPAWRSGKAPAGSRMSTPGRTRWTWRCAIST